MRWNGNGRLRRQKRNQLLCMGLTVCLLAGCLSGCGGEFGSMAGKDAVSGGAVSGGAVSGSAIGDKDADASAVNASAVDKYTFCNEKNLYYTIHSDPDLPSVYIDEDWGEADILYERSLEYGDGTDRKIEIKAIADVCYVDNDWVYYSRENTEGVLNQIWRAPIEKPEWEVNEERAELILEENEEFDDTGKVWCDGKYVVYVTGDTFKYRQYNIEKRMYEGNDWLEEREDYTGVLFVYGKNAFIGYLDVGVVRKELDSDEIETIDADISAFLRAVTETDLYWVEYDSADKDSADKDSVYEKFIIWQYHMPDGSRKKFITDTQLRKLLEKEGVLECFGEEEYMFSVAGMFVRQNRLYAEIGLIGEGEGDASYVNMVMVSKAIDAKGELRYEDKLTECLKNPEENQKVFEKYNMQKSLDVIYLSRGICVAMTEEMCVMYLENGAKKKNMWACYDFSTEELRFVMPEDEGWYLRFFDRYNTCLDGTINDYYNICAAMPNNDEY